MVRLDADPFLDQLAQMIVRNKEAGSVVVTMKRSPPVRTTKKIKLADTEECKCLIRASDGKKKISAMVTAKEYARFQTFYSNIVKAHMDGLREKSKKKSTRSHVSG